MEQKKMKQSLGRRVTMMQLALMVLMAVLLSLVSYTAFVRVYLRFYFEKSQNIVSIAAENTDWERIEPYVETGEPDEYAQWLMDYYATIKKNFTGVDFFYLFVPGEDSFTYIIDARIPSDDPSRLAEFGEVYEYGESEYEHLVPDVKAGKGSTEIVTGKAAGQKQALYVWAPVFDKDGNLRAMVEADTTLELINTDMNSFVLPVLLTFLLSMGLGLVIMLFFMRRSVTDPLRQLTELVNSYDHGKMDESLTHFRHDDEMRYLGESFQEMSLRIDKYIHDLTAVTAEKERIGAELNVATQIQADMLPRIFPAFPERSEFDLYATMNPAKEVGGDFYDYFLIDDDHLALVMADVSGKGVPAALFMVIAKTLLKNRAQSGGDPGEILADVNNQLCEGNEAELFVTTWLGILTISTGRLVTASAGHEYPALCRGEEGFDLVKDRHGPPLASMEDMIFRETELQLQHGDAIFVYTDGVAEACNAEKEFYGTDRMLQALNSHFREDPQALIANVRKDVDGFVGEADQFDDITMLCLRFH